MKILYQHITLIINSVELRELQFMLGRYEARLL